MRRGGKVLVLLAADREDRHSVQTGLTPPALRRGSRLRKRDEGRRRYEREVSVQHEHDILRLTETLFRRVLRTTHSWLWEATAAWLSIQYAWHDK